MIRSTPDEISGHNLNASAGKSQASRSERQCRKIAKRRDDKSRPSQSVARRAAADMGRGIRPCESPLANIPVRPNRSIRPCRRRPILRFRCRDFPEMGPAYQARSAEVQAPRAVLRVRSEVSPGRSAARSAGHRASSEPARTREWEPKAQHQRSFSSTSFSSSSSSSSVDRERTAGMNSRAIPCEKIS